MLKAQAESFIRNLIGAALLLGSFGVAPLIPQTATARINRTPVQPRSTVPSATPVDVVRATLDSQRRIAAGLLGRSQFGLPLNEPERAAKLYFGITANQVRVAFAKWIRPDGFVQVVLGPASQYATGR